MESKQGQNYAVVKTDPFTSNSKTIEIPSGKTILELLELSGIHIRLWSQVKITVDGKEIYRKHWKYAKPRAGANLVMVVLPGKNIWKVVVGAILTVVGIFVPVLLPLGIGLLLGGIAELIFKPPQQELTAAVSAPGQQSSFALTGQTNPTRRYGAVQRLYGRYRAFPPVAANPYTVWVGSNQFLHIIYDVTLGQIDPYTMEILIGESTLDSYQDIDWNIVHWPTDNFKHYTNDVFTEQYNIKLEKDAAEVRTTIADTDSIQVDLLFPSGLFSSSKNGKNSNASVEFIIEISPAGMGTWANVWDYNLDVSDDINLSGPRTSITVKATDFFTSASGYYWKYKWVYIRGVKTLTKTKYKYWYYYEIYRNTIPEGATEIILDSGALPTINSLIRFGGVSYKVTAIDIPANTFTLDRGLEKDFVVYYEKRYGSRFYRNKKTIGYAYWLDATDRTFKYTDNFNAALYTSIIISEFPRGQYDVRITKTSETGAGDYKHYYDLTWTALNSIKLTPPINTKLEHTFLEVKIKANEQLSGSLNNVSIECQSVLDVWDVASDSWGREATSNPAWIFVDLLTGDINPRKLDKSRLDMDSIIEWAEYCDTIRTFEFEGETKEEPYFTANYVHDYNTTLKQAIDQICSAGRASMVINNGKYGVILEKEQTIPIQVFTPRNTWEFSSGRSYVKAPHALKVKFVDPNSNWQLAEQITYNDGYNLDGSGGKLVATEFIDVDTFACTSPSMAWRLGRYWLAQAIHRQEVITINVDIEHMVCMKGDLVRWQQDVMKSGGLPVRVRALDLTTRIITLDAPVTKNATDVYYVEVRKNNGAVELHHVTFVSLDGYELTLDNLGGIEVDNLLVYGVADSVTVDMIVSTITPNSDLSATIGLIEYAPQILNADIEEIPAYSPDISPVNIIEDVPPAPLIISLDEEIEHINRQAYSNVRISWSMEGGTTWTRMEIARLNDQDNWQIIGYVEALSGDNFYIDPILASDNFRNIVKDTEVCYRIRAVGTTGGAIDADTAPTECLILEGDVIAPDSPVQMSMNLQADTLLLVWGRTVATDIGGYRLKYSPRFDTNLGWNDSGFFIQNIPFDATSVSVAYRPGTYILKAFDTSGNISIDDIRAISSAPDLRYLSPVETLIPEPDWVGTKINTQIKGGELWMAETGVGSGVYQENGEYIFNELVDLGEIYTVKLASFLQDYALEDGVYMNHATWTPLDALAFMNDVGADDETVVIAYYRTTDELNVIADWPTMDVIDPISQGTIDWKDWRPFFSCDATGRIFQFKFIMTNTSVKPNVTPVIKSGKITIDIPYRNISIEDQVALGSGVTTVTYDYPYYTIPSVIINPQDMTQGDYFTITNKNTSSFDLQFFDGTGTPLTVQRTADILISGKGRRWANVI